MSIKQGINQKRQSRKRKVKSDNPSNERICKKPKRETANAGRSCDDLFGVPNPVSPLRTPRFHHMDVSGNISSHQLDVTNTSIITSLPVITSTPKPTRRTQTLWRPWLPTFRDTRRNYALQNRRRHPANSPAHIKHGEMKIDSREHVTKFAPFAPLHNVHHHGVFSPTFPPATTHYKDTPRFHAFQGKQENFHNHAQPSHPHRQQRKNQISSPAVQVSTGFELFKHPVKLMWPKSKAYDYMFRDGQKLLDNFPIQATIGLYDDTDSEQSYANDAFPENLQIVPSHSPFATAVRN